MKRVNIKRGKVNFPTTASREERQRFWAAIMRDRNQEIGVRLKASELLAKSEGDFLERIAATANIIEPPQIIVNFTKTEPRGDGGVRPVTGDEE